MARGYEVVFGKNILSCYQKTSIDILSHFWVVELYSFDLNLFRLFYLMLTKI